MARRSHAQPREECRRVGIEAGRHEAVHHRLALEVHRGVCERGGDVDARRFDLSALPRLRGGVIHFEHAQPIGVRVAIAERIEAGTEQHILRDAALDGLREPVFRETAPNGHERAQRPRHSVVLAIEVLLQFGGGVAAKNTQRERIVEDPRGLVSRTSSA